MLKLSQHGKGKADSLSQWLASRVVKVAQGEEPSGIGQMGA